MKRSTNAIAQDEFGDIDAILGGTFDAGSGQGDKRDTSSSSSSSSSGDRGSSSSGGNSAGGDGGVVGGGGGSGGVDASREEVGGMKVPELKERCKALGLKVGGKKAELQARILEALQ